MRNVLHIIGAIIGVATPIVVAAQGAIPTGTKVGVSVGILAALLTNLGRVFGGLTDPAPKP